MNRKKACSSACWTHLSQVLSTFSLVSLSPVIYKPVTKSGFPLITIPSTSLPPFHILPLWNVQLSMWRPQLNPLWLNRSCSFRTSVCLIKTMRKFILVVFNVHQTLDSDWVYKHLDQQAYKYFLLVAFEVKGHKFVSS